MTDPAYELETAAPARRALTNRLPPDIAIAAFDFITGPLVENPRRVGRVLAHELAGIYSARLARDWRVLYEVDEDKRIVRVLDVRHRGSAYRFR